MSRNGASWSTGNAPSWGCHQRNQAGPRDDGLVKPADPVVQAVAEALAHYLYNLPWSSAGFPRDHVLELAEVAVEAVRAADEERTGK